MFSDEKREMYSTHIFLRFRSYNTDMVATGLQKPSFYLLCRGPIQNSEFLSTLFKTLIVSEQKVSQLFLQFEMLKKENNVNNIIFKLVFMQSLNLNKVLSVLSIIKTNRKTVFGKQYRYS